MGRKGPFDITALVLWAAITTGFFQCRELAAQESIAAAGIFLFHTTLLDPIASMVVAALILSSSWSLLRSSGSLLMLSVPPHIVFEEVQGALAGLPGATRIHDLHVWSLGEGTVALSCHLVAADSADRSQLLGAAQGVLRERFSIAHSVIQIESEGLPCAVECLKTSE